MGSYNLVCGASTQVITEGSRCRVVVLVQEAGYNPLLITGRDGQQVEVSQISRSNTAPTSFWLPQTLFLEATYVGYGRIELEATPTTVLSLIGFLRGARFPMVTPEGSKHHESGFDLMRFLKTQCPAFAAAVHGSHADHNCSSLALEVPALWSYLSNAVSENRAFEWSAIIRQVRQMAMFVVHEEAFKGLVDFTKGLTDYGGFCFDPESFVQRVMAYAQEDLSRMSSTQLATADADVTKSIEDHFFQSALFDGLTHAGRLDSHQLGTVRRMVGDGEFMDSFRVDMPLESRVERAWPVIESIYAHIAVDRLSLTFCPVRSCVSDDGVAPGLAFAAFVAGVSARVAEADEVQCYGPYQSYSARFCSLPEALEWKRVAPSLDVALRDFDVDQADSDGQVSVRFRITAGLEDLVELLQDRGYVEAAASLRLMA